MDFSEFWKLESLRPRCQHGHILMRTLPGWQTAAFCLCPQRVERWRALVSSSSYKGTDPTTGPHPHNLP